MGPNLLVVDDEASMRESLRRLLTAGGYSVRVADCAHAALSEARRERPDLVLLDIRLPDTSGLDVLTRLKQMDQRTEVIVMTAYESARGAVLAMKRGAYDYLSKPFNIDAIRLLVKQALDNRRDRKGRGGALQPSRSGRPEATRTGASGASRGAGLPGESRTRSSGGTTGGTTWQGSACDRMIGASPAINKVLDIIHRLPPNSTSNVLIEGETGTGKELLAHAIHEMNGRGGAPFVAIGCGAIPRELMESELFGYDKGAFTGARREGKRGAFERAGTGTIFLDDIGELDLDLQVKLLRVLEAREFSRVGGTGEIQLGARVIAATNRDLKREVDSGRFRADIYFRLNVLRVRLPALRERGGDIILLAEAFLREFNERFGKDFRSISPAARKLLEGYAWPGNVRELRNIVERIVLLETGPTILPEALTTCLPADGKAPEDTEGNDYAVHSRLPCRLASVRPSQPGLLRRSRLPSAAGASCPDGGALRWHQDAAALSLSNGGGEKEQIALALERTGGNVVRAAHMLGLKRGALRYRMEKFDITREWPYLSGVPAVLGQDGPIPCLATRAK